MKIICVDYNSSLCNNEKSDTFNIKGEPFVYFKPDSSILKNGKPFFLPDYFEQVTVTPGLVFMIDRLGKGIPEKFAGRYWNNVTVGTAFTADGVKELSIATGFDQSLSIGGFVDQTDCSSTEFSFSINGKEVFRNGINNYIEQANRIIAKISNYCTFKTGDLVFIGTPAGQLSGHECITAEIGMRLSGCLDHDTVLDFYVR